MEVFVNCRLRLSGLTLDEAKARVRAVFGANLTSMEWFEAPALAPEVKRSGGPLLPPKTPDTLADQLGKYKVTLPANYAKWKTTWRALQPEPIGQISGLPGLRGKLIATDGVKAILVLPNGHWAYVHVLEFLPDEGSERPGYTGKPRKERAEKSSKIDALAEYF